MAQMLLIMGESGTGKSTSMRNCDPATTAVVNPVGKPLPFKGKFTMLNSEVESRKICKFMKEQAAAGKKLLVVDDFQYILSVPYMNRIKENGWDKWNDFGANYFEIIEVCKELPDDVVVAYMTHTETLENGVTTIKLIGKLLREKITIEGLFTIVLRTGVNEGKYYFYTQNSGKDTVKSPMGMFPAYAIDNDLNYVADKIRNFYEVGEYKTDAEMGQADAQVASDLEKPDANGRRATAKYCGVRGNDLKIVIQKNADDASKYDVTTYFGTVKVDTQTVAKAADLVANDYVTFKAADLAVTAGTPLTGGTNGTVDGTAHQAYLDKIESYTYNTMGVVVTDDITKKLYVAFNKRLRDELGIKFQLVIYNLSADYMGVISVKNRVTDAGWSEAALVYWVTGAESGCAVNKSCQNKKYDGGFTVDTNYTQNELKAAIKAGEFTFHKVNGVVRVLEDINSMVTTSDTCGDVFKDNQTIRVIDQLGNDDAVLFNTKYLGVVPNNASGRTSLWSDLVKIRTQLQELGAIEGFTDSDVTVAQGDSKKAVVITSAITVVNAMGKLYETVTVA